MRKLIFVATSLAMVAPTMVVTTPAQAKTYKQWRGKDGKLYCRRSNGTVGVVVGGVGGALVGRAIDTRGERVTGTLLGAAAGALAGRAVDREISKRKCK